MVKAPHKPEGSTVKIVDEYDLAKEAWEKALTRFDKVIISDRYYEYFYGKRYTHKTYALGTYHPSLIPSVIQGCVNRLNEFPKSWIIVRQPFTISKYTNDCGLTSTVCRFRVSSEEDGEEIDNRDT